MEKDSLIDELKSSDLYAECPDCRREFKLSEAIIFDGLAHMFPDAAENKRKEMLEALKLRIDQLRKRKIYAEVGAEKKTMDIGIGKIVEKIVPAIPAYKELGIPPSDCRPLFEPIDYVVFKGMTGMRIDWVTFLEIKTGGSNLSKRERMIRDVIDDKQLIYEVI